MMGTGMQTEKFQSVERRLRGYESEVEQWKCDHDLAMRCMDFELMLQHGLSVFQAINFIDEECRRFVYSNAGEPLEPDAYSTIYQMYRWWHSSCDRVLEELGRHEQNFDVTYAEEFRSACREVKGLLTSDADFFSGGDLVTIRDKAIDAHRRGECEPCSE